MRYSDGKDLATTEEQGGNRGTAGMRNETNAMLIMTLVDRKVALIFGVSQN